MSLPTTPSQFVSRINTIQDRIVDRYFEKFGVTLAYWCYGFVFFYFGLQKPLPVITPVAQPVSSFARVFGIPAGPFLLFIGFYEIFLGILFFMKKIRMAFWLFFAHQSVTFLTLLVIPYTAFRPPWFTVLGIDIPWALGGFSAFVLKNVIFVGGFVLLARAELGEE